MENIFKNNQGKTVLFLGRVNNFTQKELTDFLEEKGMRYANKYENQDIALVVLSSMLTPIEEQLSYDLYDMGIADISLNKFEEYFSKHIKPNSLVMSLKLSNDQDRLKRVLQNEAFGDEIYLKLFRLYDWQNEGLYDNNDNRDITISFVKRFYRPDGFRDPAMIYAPTTVMNIAQETDNPEVLEAILTMPNHEIKVSKKENKKPKNLKEIVALNESISQYGIKQLISRDNRDINYFLASNSALTPEQQQILYNRATKDGKIMLAHNSNLSDILFEKLLDDSEDIIKTLLTFQNIDDKRLETILSKNLDLELLSFIGDNQNLKTNIIDKLLELQNRELDFKLASNSAIEQKDISKLYERYSNDIAKELAKNINLTSNMAKEFYQLNDIDIINSLASNPSTPKEILDELCQIDKKELNMLLASNPSVDIYYLQQFQLDPSLLSILANNSTYGQNVLNNLGI